MVLLMKGRHLFKWKFMENAKETHFVIHIFKLFTGFFVL